MDNTIPGKLALGPCDQVGFVYADLERAIAQYEPLFGPFDSQEYGAFEYLNWAAKFLIDSNALESQVRTA